MKIGIIGAGPAGITAGYVLSKLGHEVWVFEAGSGVGGMAKTIELWGQKVDLGPHRFFSSDPRVNKIWLEVAGSDYKMVSRLTRIYYKNKFFYYPLKPLNALANLGLWEATVCIFSFLKEKIHPAPFRDNFEGWVVSRFGRRLFEIFFKAYSEKLWGISCTELDADFAAQRIKKLSLWEAVKNAVTGGKGNKHKTLVDEFAYPTGGTGMIYDRMAEYISTHNGQVVLNMPVVKVSQSGNRVTGLVLTDGREFQFDHVISSMPVSALVKTLDSAPGEVKAAAARLRFRNTLLVYLEIEGTGLFPDNWLYVHASDLKTGRIPNFRNWVPELTQGKDTSILVLEYWCYDSDPIWTQDSEALILLARNEIRKTGLIGDKSILNGEVIRVPKCYPVYFTGYKQIMEPVVAFLRTVGGLSVIGRYGSYKYNNQDHSILMGLLAAQNIALGEKNDLWQINTDYDYQESASITETGMTSSQS